MISIVIKVYNEEKYINECLLSIYKQISSEDEIIIVDDGSTDNSSLVIKDFVLKNNSKNIFYYHKKNGGPGSACNTGISKATKEYVYIMDGDDVLSKDAIPLLKKVLHEQNPDMLIFDIDHVLLSGEINNITSNLMPDRLNTTDVLSNLFNIVPSVTNKVVRREILLKSKLLFLDLLVAEDLNYMTKLYSFVNSYYYLPKVKYKYIERKGSIISSNANLDKNKDVIFAIRDIVDFYKSNKVVQSDLYNLIQTHGYLFTIVRILKNSDNYNDNAELLKVVREECSKMLETLNVNSMIKVKYYITNPKFTILKILDKLSLLKLDKVRIIV